MQDMLINMGVSVILEMLKSNALRKKWAKAMLKVFKAIWLAYGSTPEFQAAVEAEANK